MKFSLLIILLLVQLSIGSNVRADDKHEHSHEHEKSSDTSTEPHNHTHDHTAEHAKSANHQHSKDSQHTDDHQHATEHAHEDAVTITAAMAENVGITVASVAPGTIERHIPLYGELALVPNRQAQVRARFPGMITQLKAGVSDNVKKGDVLAVVESNDSLRTYSVVAPIAGMVIQQWAGQGEYTAGEPLFLLADSSVLWGELKVFPAARDEVKTGLPVHIEARGGRIDSQITHILPVSGQPYVVARVELNNHEGRFAAGERVSALVDAEIIQVPLVVDNRALQDFEGKSVVFIREGERYEPRALQLGRTDGRFTEVLTGVHATEQYVVANSYLIKAELEKSAAAHEH